MQTKTHSEHSSSRPFPWFLQKWIFTGGHRFSRGRERGDRSGHRQDSPRLCQGGSLPPLTSSYWPSIPRPDACNPVPSCHCPLLGREDSNRSRVLFWGACQQHRSGPQLWLRTNRLGCQLAQESLSTISGSSFATIKSSVKRLGLTSVNRNSGIPFILLDNFHLSCKELENTQRVFQPWVRVWKWFSDIFDCSLSIMSCADAISWVSALPFLCSGYVSAHVFGVLVNEAFLLSLQSITKHGSCPTSVWPFHTTRKKKCSVKRTWSPKIL